MAFLHWIAIWMWAVIAGIGIAHIALLVLLGRERQKARRRMTDFFVGILQSVRSKTSPKSDRDPDEQIKGFIEDVGHILQDASREEDKKHLHDSLRFKDEDRPYLESKRLRQCHSVAMTLVEVYTLAGIFGTVLAIGISMKNGDNPAPVATTRLAATESETPPATLDTAKQIVKNFGAAIWSTVAGLVCAIVFMLCHAWVDPGFESLFEVQTRAREVVARARRELGITAVQQKEKA